MEDLIIIGAGPVGLYGATLAALHNLKGKIIEASNQVGGQLTSLYPEKNIIDLPGFESVTAQEYINKLESQFLSNPNHLDLLLNESVMEFEYPDDKMIELSKRIKLIVDDKSRYTDWSTRDDIKANLQVDLILLLDEFDYPPVTIDDVYKEVLEQAENFKKYAV